MRSLATVELGGRLRDQHPGAELLRLIVRAPSQLLSRDAEGEPEIVFDLRARPRLATRRVCFDDDHVQSFRRRIHRCAEPGGPRPDDDDVPDLRAIERRVQAEAVGELLNRRILQHDGAAADHDRHVGGAHVELVEQLLAFGIGVEISDRVRVAVAREELEDV